MSVHTSRTATAALRSFGTGLVEGQQRVGSAGSRVVSADLEAVIQVRGSGSLEPFRRSPFENDRPHRSRTLKRRINITDPKWSIGVVLQRPLAPGDRDQRGISHQRLQVEREGVADEPAADATLKPVSLTSSGRYPSPEVGKPLMISSCIDCSPSLAAANCHRLAISLRREAARSTSEQLEHGNGSGAGLG